MKENKTLGWLIIIISCLIPMILLFTLGPKKDFTNYKDITHALGQITGLIGMTLFALTFVFSTRLKFIEDMFGGLDKVYKMHSILGSYSLSLLLFHPIFLVLKFIPDNMGLAGQYLLFGDHISVNLGIIALLGMILLIYLTFFSKLKYHVWKFSHQFFGLFFILAVLHIFLVRDSVAQDYIFKGYPVYVYIVSIIGVVAFIYSLIIRINTKRELYVVDNVLKPNNDVYDIYLAPVNKPIQYRAGQFIFVSFQNKEVGKEPHPFSIASDSKSDKIRIMVKKLGDYTTKLEYLKKGDKVKVEGPYGRFKQESKLDQVWLAGGIGITPFIGMAEDLTEKTKNKIDLIYTARQDYEFVNVNKFRDVEKKCHNFRFYSKASDKEGYLTINEIIQKTGPIQNKEVYICGPGIFKDLMIQGALKAGVLKQNIHWEDFNFR